MLYDSSDFFRTFTDGDASDGVSGEFDSAYLPGGSGSAVEIGSPLNDAEEGLIVGSGVRLGATFEPANGPFVGFVETPGVVLRGIGGAFGRWAVIEGHDDIGSEVVLDAGGFFRGEVN